MRSLALILFFACSSVGAAQDDFEPTYYTSNEWNEWFSKVRSADEVRMVLTEPERVDVPKKWTKDGIEFESKAKPRQPLHIVKGSDGIRTFVEALEFKPQVEQIAHGCRGLFNLLFYREGVLVAHLHFAHGEYWWPLTKHSQDAINDWLVSHGFPLEAVLKKDAREKG